MLLQFMLKSSFQARASCFCRCADSTLGQHPAAGEVMHRVGDWKLCSVHSEKGRFDPMHGSRAGVRKCKPVGGAHALQLLQHLPHSPEADLATLIPASHDTSQQSSTGCGAAVVMTSTGSTPAGLSSWLLKSTAGVSTG